MKAIILAAGEGTRLRPYTLDRPKCLVAVDGIPLLDRQLATLYSQGIDDVVLLKGYLGDKWNRPGTRSLFNAKYATTNMLWTLFCARNELDESSVISYGDIVYSERALARVVASEADIAVAIDRDWEAYWRARSSDPLADAETLKLGPEGNIIEIGQKPKSFAEIEGQYIGLMKFTAKGFAALKRLFDDGVRTHSIRGKLPEKAYMTDALQALIDRGEKLTPVFIDSPWIEVDTVEDLNAAVTKERLARLAEFK